MNKTKREGFSFLNSYYQVYQRLSAKDKVIFMDKLLEVQFLKCSLENITFDSPMVDMGFNSIMHSLQSTIDGYLVQARKHGAYIGAYQGGTQGATIGATQEEEEKVEEEVEVEEKEEEQYAIMSFSKKIISHLNKVSGKSYKAGTAKTKALISARRNEGFTYDDFKSVIDKKTREWKNEAKMSVYIRPETLFGTKFESYLQQDEKVSKSKAEVGSLAWELEQMNKQNNYVEAEVL